MVNPQAPVSPKLLMRRTFVSAQIHTAGRLLPVAAPDGQYCARTDVVERAQCRVGRVQPMSARELGRHLQPLDE